MGNTPQTGWSRRRFLEFMGRGTAILAALPMVNMLESCAVGKTPFNLSPLQPSTADRLLLAEGFHYDVLINWGDRINNKGDIFGFNCDYIAYIPLKDRDNEGLLWVNHEYPDRLFLSGYGRGMERTREQAVKELKAVGGSIVKVRMDKDTGRWDWQYDSKYNRRLDAFTPIPIIAERPIEGSKVAIGTFGNCAGGVTPWNTILTCEENTIEYFGGVKYISSGERVPLPEQAYYGYNRFFDNPPEHYGWVVEVDPLTGKAKKLTGMGRFAHECATVKVADDGRCVVYSGDDENDEHLYKYIADVPGSLDAGKLYVANMEEGKWESLNIVDNPMLRDHFKDQTELLIRTRDAAKLVNATPLDRPEDVEIDPVTGSVIVSLTKNIPKGNYYGSLLRLREHDNDPLSLRFSAENFISGGLESGFACPDNLAFDRNGNLWMTTDISGNEMKIERYKPFGHNGLFYIPMSGASAGIPFLIASAPVDAELTGPWFAPDGMTLFLSVQHPGETTTSLDDLKSNWPDGGNAIPRPAVVAISGAGMDALLS